MGCTGSKELSVERMVEGLKAALDVAAREACRLCSAPGGFEDGPLHIPIPGTLGEVMEKLKKLPGIGDKVEEFEKTMNQAAEAAAGAAVDVFVNAINTMEFSDAKNIMEGASNAATVFFRNLLEADLMAKFAPIVNEKMNDLGCVSVYTTLCEAYEAIPFVGSKVDFNIGEYVTDKAFNGLFVKLEECEASVRGGPALHGAHSEVLGECFPQKK